MSLNKNKHFGSCHVQLTIVQCVEMFGEGGKSTNNNTGKTFASQRVSVWCVLFLCCAIGR